MLYYDVKYNVWWLGLSALRCVQWMTAVCVYVCG